MNLSVYSDGLVSKDGYAGAAYCIFRGPSTEVAHRFIPLGKTIEIYDAEIYGVLEGLRAAPRHSMDIYATDLIIYLDNEEAALRLNTGIPTSTSSCQIAEFQSHRKKWEIRTKSIVHETGKVFIQWIPSHSNIRVNERADTLAITAQGMITTRTSASAAKARRLKKHRYETEISACCCKNAPERYCHGLKINFYSQDIQSYVQKKISK